MLRCKVGDLAFLVRSAYGCEGRIFKILSYHGDHQFIDGPLQKDCWLVQGNSHSAHLYWCREQLGADGLVADSALRPIRPGDLEDESVTDVIKEQTCEHQ